MKNRQADYDTLDYSIAAPLPGDMCLDRHIFPLNLLRCPGALGLPQKKGGGTKSPPPLGDLPLPGGT
jgi:hypothetical protein